MSGSVLHFRSIEVIEVESVNIIVFHHVVLLSYMLIMRSIA